jgi:hypothetical protein
MLFILTARHLNVNKMTQMNLNMNALKSLTVYTGAVLD